MKVLVANLGSTSFKYRLLDMDGEIQMARGGIERIGSEDCPCFVEIDGKRTEETAPVPDHAEAVRKCLSQLTDPDTGCLDAPDDVSAIGFKAVLAAGYTGVQFVTPELLDAMEELAEVMPAHNPPYIRAMRQLSENLPEIPLVAAFETGFHQTIPERNRYYGVPWEWARKYNVVRWGFHGASHRYIATRAAELTGREDLRIISCHVGGSSSLCAIQDGKSRAASMGTSAQTGLPHNNRVGDFDPFMLPYLSRKTGKSIEELLTTLATESGLLGLSGVSSDIRDIREAAASGNDRAKLALEVLVGYTRQYLGAYLVELGGADMIVFTGGIGENGVDYRSAVTEGLEELGIVMDPRKNAELGGREGTFHADESRVALWVIPTNEELIVARQTRRLIEEG
jgi:acetate kinase